jgi:hypothetical protein
MSVNRIQCCPLCFSRLISWPHDSPTLCDALLKMNMTMKMNRKMNKNGKNEWTGGMDGKRIRVYEI